jgi:hypothetical protein
MRRPSAYRVYLTRNSEYHVRGLTCFGVRDRRSASYVADHWALGQRLDGTFPDASGHIRACELPVVGESLSFRVRGELHRTSAILAVEERASLEIDALGRTPLYALSRPRSHAARETY